jgi:CBS domain-containing protein
MTNKRVRHLPVIDDGQLIGIISIGDLVKSIISDQNVMIDQLEHFFARRTLMDANAILFSIALGVLLVGVPSFGFWLQRPSRAF